MRHCLPSVATGLAVLAASSTALEIPTNYSSASLPDMRTFLNGTYVETPEQWRARRAEMWELLQQYYYGTVPKPAQRPGLAGFRLLNESTVRGVTDQWFEATFMTPKAPFSVAIEVLSPEGNCSSNGPMPLFITQTNHRRWGFVAVARGHVAMITPTSDNDCAGGNAHCDEGDPTAPLAAAFPDATFQLITRRAYLTSLCIDFALAALPQHPDSPAACVNASQISMTGHSRNGKQTLIAAALDERITAAMDSSSGVPAASTYRFNSAPSFCETPTSSWPGPWWLPSVRSWAGREDQLPMDSHFLFGLIAPRHVLSAVAWTEAPNSAFNVEQSIKAAQAVYAWLGVPERVRLDSRPGAHHGFESVPRYIDWADYAFGRLPPMFPDPSQRWPERGGFLHDFDLQAWLQANPKPASLPGPGAPPEQRVAAMLGAPLGAAPGWSPGGKYEPAAYLESMIPRAGGDTDGVTQAFVDFGSYLRGTLLFPSGAATDGGSCLPGVVWLHPLSYQSGWVEAYLHAGRTTAEGLAFAGYGHSGAVVIAFDQVGFGTRQHEGRDFYARQPGWSRLGQMVADARSAIDVLLSNQSSSSFRPSGSVDRLDAFPCVDPNRIYLVGYSVGGAVALHAAALDDRVAGVVSVSGFEPLRSGTTSRRSGGNARWFGLHATQPQLAWFNGTEADIPYDYDDLVRMAAPARVLVYAPRQDRENDADLVAGLVRPLVGARVQLQQPDAINVMDSNATFAVRDFIAAA